MSLNELLFIARSNGSNTTTSSSDALSQEIQCYSLPYGALGFVSHVLTYYTILCLWFGRKPFWPFSHVAFSRFDLALGGFGLLISTCLSVVTIVRCKDTWQLLVIAVWKLSMSLLNGITAIHVAILFILSKVRAKRSRREEGSEATVVGVPTLTKRRQTSDGRPDEKDEEAVSEEGIVPISIVVNPLRSVFWWIILYIPGMFAGMVGLMSLVVQNKGHAGVSKLTAGFYSIVGAGFIVILMGLIYRLWIKGEDRSTAKKLVIWGIVWALGAFSILAVFFSDWALGMMTGNVTGLPSGDTAAIYWTYFIAKRLPMFSW